MTSYSMARCLPLVAAGALAAAAGAQSGRIVVQIAPAVTGQNASFQLQHPLSFAGTYYMTLYSMPPLNAAVPAPIPGFNVSGLLRIDPATAVLFASGLLDATGRTAPAVLGIPNNPALVGQQFDVQALDINFLTNTLTFSDNDVTATITAPFAPAAALNLVSIPAGTFQMGSAAFGGIALPVHPVQISQPFWLGKYEVTQAEYQALMASNPSASVDPNKPVERVSWNQAMAYCAALTRREAQAGRLPPGYVYRLPTEAEWELACRAGTTTTWTYGASLACTQANFSGCVGQTRTVGSYAANARGLHDVHGNVAEWVLDATDGTANYPVSFVADPYIATGASRIARGGGFGDTANNCQSGARLVQLPTYTSNGYGFRVALAPVRVEPSLGMVAIAPGSFVQGDDAGPTLPFYNGAVERPAHVTSLTQPFWIGRHEVTQAQYQALMNANPSASVGPNKPVEQVTWQQARAYCDALTAREGAAGRLPWGYEYRLPTEAEWEYCCRAGTTTAYHTGATIGCAQANLFDPALGSCVGQTSAVGTYAPNAWGLYDMHGNVREFCLDAWTGTAGYVATPLADPLLVAGSYRIDRGGSYASLTTMGRAAFRSSMLNGLPSAQVGFRVVLAPSLSRPALVDVAPGSFAMGSTAGNANEQPVRQVTLSAGFALGRFEVTQAQYYALMGVNPAAFQSATDPTASQRPVEQVSWTEAMAYCSKLTEREAAAGRLAPTIVYRLPMEAEWEFACRAGSTTEWYTGANLTTAQANVAGALARSTTVGSYAANAAGLFDMHGNVAEWILDGFANYTAGAATDPHVTAAPGGSIVARGGGWNANAFAARSAYRDVNTQAGATNGVGFRVACGFLATSSQLSMQRINPGTFLMGSAFLAGQVGSQWCGPVHAVTISRPFWMAKYEVTQSQYVAILGNNPSQFQGPNASVRPVDTVTWAMANQYCQALNAQESLLGRVPPGYVYRLPTEAEWEYCCRAGTTTEWNTGNSLSSLQANFGSSAPSIIGTFPPNGFGLFDMHGNMLEWCADSTNGDAFSPGWSGQPRIDPIINSGPSRSTRGGCFRYASFVTNEDWCRSGSRYGYALSSPAAYDFHGFRVVLAPVLP